MNVALIPLRSGSKRLKDKNIIDFFGKPIFSYPLETACKSGLFDSIILACDADYKELVKANIYVDNTTNTPISVYVRSEENSKDESPLIDLVGEVTRHYNLTGNMCILYSTSVLTTIEQLKQGLDKLEDDNCVFPVIKQKGELYTVDNICYEIKGHYLTSNAYHADAWFWFKIKEILESRKIIQDQNGYIELKDYEAQPIHTIEDIEDLKNKYMILTKRYLI